MKDIKNVESMPSVPARFVSSPKVKDKIIGPPSKKKQTKSKNNPKDKSKKASEAEIFGVIGNPNKMSEKPKSDNKKKKKKTDKFYDSSDGSMTSLSSLDGKDSFGSIDSGEFTDDGSFDSELSGSSFEGNRRGSTMRRRKDEIMQEKIEMLTRISNMSRTGFTASKKWSMKDDIEEIRFECYRMTINREKNSKFAVKYVQQMLITVASIIEFASGLNNPFNMKLQGFSKNLMLTVSADYDNQLEELHHKWSGRTSLGPGMQILLTFVTSAIYHHAGNSMGAGTEKTTTSKPAEKSGPSMSSVLGLFSNMMPKTAPPRTRTTVSTPKPNESETSGETKEEPKKRRTMKGPGCKTSDVDNVAPSMQVPES